MVRKLLLILGLGGLIPISGSAQIDYANISFSHFEHSLSQNTGYCMLEDHVGFLWIGTQNGLNRFDGIQIKAYKYSALSPKSIPSNTIYNIFEDSDNTLWVVTKKGLARYNRELDSFSPFIHDPQDPLSIPSGDLGASILEDKENHIWFLADQLACYDKASGQFLRYSLPVDTSLNAWERKNGLFIFQDSHNNFWYSCYNSLYLFNPTSGTFKKILGRADFSDLDGKNLRMRAMVEDQDGVLWMAGLDAGLIRLDFSKGTPDIQSYSQFLNLEAHKITHVFIDKDNALWFSSENEGLFILTPDRQNTFFYKHDPSSHASISSVSIQSIYQDSTGRIWLGNYSTGLDYVDTYAKKFRHFHYSRNEKSLSYNNISSFVETPEGNIWIGTDGGGLNRFHPQTHSFEVFHNDPEDPTSISSDAILDLAYDPNGRLWIAHWEGGISAWDGEHFTRFTTENSGLSSNNISALLHDEQHRHYLGTQGNGLIIFNSQSNTWKYFNSKTHPNFSLDLISDICRDKFGNIWIGGIGGLVKLSYDPSQKEHFESFSYTEHGGSLSDPRVEVIYESREGQLWVGTKNGLNRLNENGKTFTSYTVQDGLPDNTVEGIVEDATGNLWVSTHNGLSRIAVQDGRITQLRNYGLADGIQSKQFNRGAAFVETKGRLYFGGVNGFNQIDLATLKDNPHIPPIVLTDFKLFNQPVSPSEKGPIQKHIASSDTIVLTHNQSVFSFDFSALNFTHPENNQYAYMLEGFDEDWYYIGNQHTATFTNIPHGNYTFKVKASNNDGVWNEAGKSISLIILPPWWKTPLAYVLYVLAGLGLLLLIRKITLIRFEYKQREKLLEKEREIDQLKLQFFTNISHEFKTPLTLILAPLEKLIAVHEAQPIHKPLSLIQRNAKRLQQLITQLLDLRTLDSGKYVLQLQESDIIAFLHNTFVAFSPLAERYQIQYVFNSWTPTLICKFDMDILDKVIYNILSNAFKYTPNGGRIEMNLRREGRFLAIRVADNGLGVASDQREKIFDRFYRIEGNPIRKEEGTGIGLTLSKELIQLHEGDIQLEPLEHKGSTFCVRLPFLPPSNKGKGFSVLPTSKQIPHFATPTQESAPFPPVEKRIKGEKQLVFIVEDNPDLRHFLHEQLAEDFEVQSFENGELAIEPVVEHIPDLVLSDVMMPVMDGITFCQKIKQNPHSSHIPVIMLTAKSSEEGQLKGLGVGADDYILKPFSLPILRAKIASILRNRQILWEKLKDHKLIAPAHLVKGQRDRIFLEELTQTIERYIEDTSLNYQILCKEMGMSKTQLYKKLRALTGKSVHEIIKEVRLKKAAELLYQEEYSISEVASKVGFKHLANFSTHFKTFFGQPPSQFHKN